MAKSLIHKDISNFHNVTSLLKSMGYMLKSDRLLDRLSFDDTTSCASTSHIWLTKHTA